MLLDITWNEFFLYCMYVGMGFGLGSLHRLYTAEFEKDIEIEILSNEVEHLGARIEGLKGQLDKYRQLDHFIAADGISPFKEGLTDTLKGIKNYGKIVGQAAPYGKIGATCADCVQAPNDTNLYQSWMCDRKNGDQCGTHVSATPCPDFMPKKGG